MVYGSYFGFNLNTWGSTIRGNNCSKYTAAGMWLEHCKDCLFEDNYFFNNGDGLVCYNGLNLTIHKNYFSKNKGDYFDYFDYVSLNNVYNSTISDNNFINASVLVMNHIFFDRLRFSGNYWNHPHLTPKLIVGFYVIVILATDFHLPLPRLYIDPFPAMFPNGGTESSC